MRKKFYTKTLNDVSEMLTEDPTLYLAQIRSALIDDHGVKVSRSTICRAIHLSEQDGGLGLSLQVLEKRALQRSARDRANWHDRINAGDFDHKNVIVIDESNVGKNMSRRRRGYGKAGQRVRCPEYLGKDLWERYVCVSSPYTHLSPFSLSLPSPPTQRIDQTP